MKSDLLSRIETSTGTGKSAGQLELLLFRLDDRTLYGINVFKIKEILPCPPVNLVPMADPRTIGLIDLRGQILSVVDLARALELPPLDPQGEEATCLYTEFSRQQLGFLVRNVERIIYVHWHDVRLPPETLSHNPYLTAITPFEGELVQIIDIERVLADILPESLELDSTVDIDPEQMKRFTVIGVDDSRVARNHLKKIFEHLGVDFQLAEDGKKALDLLGRMVMDAEDGMAPPVHERLLAVVSDVEMPEMDGYMLTEAIRRHPQLKTTPIILNSSISSEIGEQAAMRAGASDFLTKWDANTLAERLLALAQQRLSKQTG
ncbi:two-component system, chemotaxis family, response regulator CheV [Sulfurivirga caldicuralii]|uniref:Two-component system, chemotaxis family, response regulator CheV n=1 Tax=Sulfurivirga caldicuralii TaxID=364032 RepID=A0A1N6GVX6_9GAMM|nr:chemotaxis protein [Sulfurivirga caldicuralii]SIO11703.1 two-component system, chemotaxis family, response regulator CheV [Sulfurivirga caldicuralii]